MLHVNDVVAGMCRNEHYTGKITQIDPESGLLTIRRNDNDETIWQWETMVHLAGGSENGTN